MKEFTIASLRSVPSSKSTVKPALVSPTQRILNWNLKRNQLSYNIDLESAMLAEEANEFFTAQTLVDRLDAWADFAFVAIGTACKYMGKKSKCFMDIRDDYKEFNELAEYINTVQAQMITMLSEELQLIAPNVDIDDLLGNVLMLVVEANELKGFELNADGKVIKPANFVKPEFKIDCLLATTFGSKYTPTHS